MLTRYICLLGILSIPDLSLAKTNDELQIAVTGFGSNPPSFDIITNVPSGVVITLELRGDIPGCVIQCGYGGSATVTGGHSKVDITADEPLEPDLYTVDLVTNDPSHKLKFLALDPTDEIHMIRWTARLKVDATGSRIVPGTAGILPFLYDAKYRRDEFDPGYQPPR